MNTIKKGGYAERAGGARARAKGKPLRVMFQDEARIGRMSDPRACWAPGGVRPVAPAQLVRQYTHVFGAVSPADDQHDSLILPYADTDAMSRFPGEAAGRHRGERVPMFMDQAARHRSGALKVPRGMELAYLPPHSPDLNPQEQVRGELREKCLANKNFGGFAVTSARACYGRNGVQWLMVA